MEPVAPPPERSVLFGERANYRSIARGAELGFAAFGKDTGLKR